MLELPFLTSDVTARRAVERRAVQAEASSDRGTTPATPTSTESAPPLHIHHNSLGQTSKPRPSYGRQFVSDQLDRIKTSTLSNPEDAWHYQRMRYTADKSPRCMPRQPKHAAVLGRNCGGPAEQLRCQVCPSVAASQHSRTRQPSVRLHLGLKLLHILIIAVLEKFGAPERR